VVVANAGVGEVVNADWICIPSVVEATKLSEPVVHVIWPTVNVRPIAMAMESGKMTISHA
jgi:hypothetical protein